MSAIFGLVRVDGPPVRRDDLEHMAASLPRWGTERAIWQDTRAGLGMLADLRTPNTGTTPTVFGDEAVVVAIGRLDNASDLARELDLGAAATDGAIMAAAWQRWGAESPRRLHGDWSFAVWSPSSRELFLARDPFGNSALSYHQTGTSFAFATSTRALFAAGVSRRLNEFRLAQHLVGWASDGAATLHEGVFRLPPGCHLTLARGRVDVRTYWRPEELPTLRLSSPEAYVERFTELFDDAVRTRLRTTGGAAVALSSGLDSGAVAAFAGRQLGKQGRSLAAFTSVPWFPGLDQVTRQTVDEWELAHATAEWIGNVEHVRVTAERVTPLAAIERSLDFHDEPEFASGNLFWMTAMFDEARDAGATVMLTGQLGNGGVSWTGDQARVVRGLVRLRLLYAWGGLRDAQRLFDGSMLRALLVQVVQPIRAKWNAAKFRRGRLPPPSMRMIAPAFTQKTQVVERMRASGFDPYYGRWVSPRAQRLLYFLPGVTPFGAVWAEKSAGFGIDLRDPTADVRLLEFCLSIPDELYYGSEGSRLLIRRAMDGRLPPAVQWNVRRGRQAADLGLRLRDDADRVGEVIRSLAKSPLVRATLNLGSLLDAWARVRAGATRTSVQDAVTLARLLHLGGFLLRLENG